MRTLSVIVFCVWFLAHLPLILILGLLCVFPKFRKLWFNLLLGIDQWGNILLCGDADTTISSRLGNCAKDNTFAHWYIKALYHLVDWGAAKFGDYNHCIKAIESKHGRTREIWDWKTGKLNWK